MQSSPLCLFLYIYSKRCCSWMRGATNESILREAFGWPACRKQKKIGNCCRFSLCACLGLQIGQHHRTDMRKLRGMLEYTSTASAADQKLAHTLTHTHPRHTSKSTLLAAAKGYKHKPAQLGPPRLETIFLCSFNSKTVSMC